MGLLQSPCFPEPCSGPAQPVYASVLVYVRGCVCVCSLLRASTATEGFGSINMKETFSCPQFNYRKCLTFYSSNQRGDYILVYREMDLFLIFNSEGRFLFIIVKPPYYSGIPRRILYSNIEIASSLGTHTAQELWPNFEYLYPLSTQA